MRREFTRGGMDSPSQASMYTLTHCETKPGGNYREPQDTSLDSVPTQCRAHRHAMDNFVLPIVLQQCLWTRTGNPQKHRENMQILCTHGRGENQITDHEGAGQTYWPLNQHAHHKAHFLLKDTDLCWLHAAAHIDQKKGVKFAWNKWSISQDTRL